MSDRPLSDADAAEAKRRAKWLHKYKAPKNWIILTVFEVSTIREEIMTLERERDEAREQAAMWKANHDNQVSLKAMLMDRPDLGDRASRIAELIRERDEARAVAAELASAASHCLGWHDCRLNIGEKITAILKRWRRVMEAEK